MKLWLPLLHCSLQELDKHLDVIAGDNPCIEIKSGISSFEMPKARTYTGSGPLATTASEIMENTTFSTLSLYEKLNEQIAAPLFPTPISQKIAKEIIYFINEEGYFEGDVKEIADNLDVSPKQVESVRQRFAYLEPSGVGATDFRESFLFQLNDIDMDDDLSLLVSSMIIRFDHMEDFISHPRFHDAKEVFKHLKHPPAMEYAEEGEVIIPDLFVSLEGGKVEIRNNNRFYPDIVVSEVDKYDNFAKQKFKEARELVKLLELRKATLYNIALVLVEKQFRFFCGGELVPLRLQDVADELGFNESTISRAIAHKYLMTENGVYAFKEFFSTSIGGVSTAEIKHFIEEVVRHEEKLNPHSDKALHEMVEKRFHIKLVRRSIAKYRAELNIPHFNERKLLGLIEAK
jgi:RNA polymerase sigma-54 factor